MARPPSCSACKPDLLGWNVERTPGGLEESNNVLIIETLYLSPFCFFCSFFSSSRFCCFVKFVRLHQRINCFSFPNKENLTRCYLAPFVLWPMVNFLLNCILNSQVNIYTYLKIHGKSKLRLTPAVIHFPEMFGLFPSQHCSMGPCTPRKAISRPARVIIPFTHGIIGIFFISIAFSLISLGRQRRLGRGLRALFILN